jgi:spondin-1
VASSSVTIQLKYSLLFIQRHPQNGGQACPKRLSRHERCFVNCPKAVALLSSDEKSTDLQAECVYGDWSEWSPCSKTCGDVAVQIRTRVVLNHEMSCTERVEKRECEILPCLVEKASGVFYSNP